MRRLQSFCLKSKKSWWKSKPQKDCRYFYRCQPINSHLESWEKCRNINYQLSDLYYNYCTGIIKSTLRITACYRKDGRFYLQIFLLLQSAACLCAIYIVFSGLYAIFCPAFYFIWTFFWVFSFPFSVTFEKQQYLYQIMPFCVSHYDLSGIYLNKAWFTFTCLLSNNFYMKS